MPAKNNLSISRRRKSTAPPLRKSSTEDDNSEMAAGSIVTDAQKEAASDRQKNLQRRQGFQIYTSPISRELNRGTINQCAPVPPREGLQSTVGVNKARKSFPPVYHKSRVIARAIRNTVLEKKSSNYQSTPGRVGQDSQGQKKEDLLVLSTTGTYIDKKETVTSRKASEIHQRNTSIGISKLNNIQLTPSLQVPQANSPKREMPKLLPITADMIFLPP